MHHVFAICVVMLLAAVGFLISRLFYRAKRTIVARLRSLAGRKKYPVSGPTGARVQFVVLDKNRILWTGFVIRYLPAIP